MSDLTSESKLNEISAKVDSLVQAYKFGALGLLVIFSLVNVIDTFAISYFRNLFRDALGPDHPLPFLTHLFLDFQALATCLAVLWPILGFLVAFKSKQISPSLFIPTGMLVIVIVQIVLTWIGLLTPMFATFGGVSDSTQH
jgi:hypothetical protein